MSKIKLIKIQGYGGKSSPYEGDAEVVDLETEIPDTHDVLAVVRTDFDTSEDGSTRVSDEINPVVRYERINDLVGKMLTIIDVTYHDKEVRQKVKDMIMQACWDWYHAQTSEMTVTHAWRKNKYPKYKEFWDSLSK